MALFLDCTFVAIIMISCIVGYVRGFKRILIGLVSTLVAAALAFWGASSLGEPVYDRYLKTPIRKEVRTAIDKIQLSDIVRPVLQAKGLDGMLSDSDINAALNMDGDFIDNIGNQLQINGVDLGTVDEVKNGISGYFGDEMLADITKELDERGLSEYINKLEIPTEDLKACVQKAASADKEEAADYISDKAVKPIAIGALKCVLFIVCFSLASLLIRIILLISGVQNTYRDLKSADRFGGLAIGAAKGLFCCGMIAFMLCFLANATKNSLAIFNADTSEQTYIFRLFFDLFYK